MDLGFFNKSKGTLKIMAILSVIAIGVIFYFGTPKTKLPIFIEWICLDENLTDEHAKELIKIMKYYVQYKLC